MDGDSKKVFVPSIGRNSCTLKNNLYDIISKDVIKPETFNHEVQGTCDFQPTGGKLYAPKKKSKLKVKTVRDIRHLYEKNILETLPYELERQQKLLLRKIRDGHAKDENTKKVALNLLNSDKPISRSSWQMLMNINPKGHNHSSQFVLWNGKCIQVNGSSGGKNKFIFNYDIYKDKESYRKVAFPKSKNLTKRRGLLRDSLNIRFKPGPLTKKKELDYSYQKYHVGEIKLVNLPKLGLDITSSYGTALEPTVTTFLQNLREEDGKISEKWAEFSVSMLGKVTNEEIQIGTNNCITFNLNYKCDQKRILMRHNIDKNQNAFQNTISSCTIVPCTTDKSVIMSEVQNILDRMLDTVEISLKQEAMYSGVDESREILTRDCCSGTSSHIKEKVKRKYNELDRLDVTVIRLSENRKDNISEPCRQLFCSLGCICDSLECAYSLKEHCGRTDCMFGCKCDFSKYRIPDSLEGDCAELLPGLFFLDKKINDRLSKEEQKFHQTVLVTDEKSILLKSKRRNWKTSKKYADFYSSMRLRNENKNQRILTIVDTKLKCENIEPWCMVHNLYKCFCKGKFTQTVAYDLTNVETNINYDVPMENEGLIVEDSTKIEPEIKDLVKPDINEITLNNQVGSSNFICARVLPYEGRKFTNGYYLRTNEKILEMEKNDKKLHAKMLSHMSQSSENELADEINTPNNIVDVADTPFKLDDLLNNILHEQESLMHSMSVEIEEEKLTKIVKELKTKRLPNKTKLVEWLESTYKKYKERVEKGMWKTLLSPPKAGKVALYPWDFILSRYQERKNLFLISIQKPFRIFMAVDARNPFFDRCINVSYIPQSKINEYPIMVRNLINNVKDLKDNFCILCGLSHCWELIGSVTKVNENKIIQTDAKSVAECISYDEGHSKNKQNNSKVMSCDTITEDKVNKNSSNQLSKWFLMTVEEDFSEIQFYKRGFFVKYDSIIKAIQVARRVGKTVRLSSQRCNDGGSSPQFGIYATPNNNENSVFIGPYERDEPLGIETLKNSVNVEDKNRTRECG